MNISKYLGKIDANLVVRVAFVGVGCLLIYRIAKRAKTNIDAYTYQVNKPTLSSLQIAGLAQKIANAWGGILNDDEEAVYAAFHQLGNMDDLVLLMRAYSYGNENLATSIQKRMSTKEINKINNILAQKGINYKF